MCCILVLPGTESKKPTIYDLCSFKGHDSWWRIHNSGFCKHQPALHGGHKRHWDCNGSISTESYLGKKIFWSTWTGNLSYLRSCLIIEKLFFLFWLCIQMQKLNSGNLFTEKGTVNIQKKKQTNNTKQKREKLKSIMFSQMLISSPHSPPPPFSKKKRKKKKEHFTVNKFWEKQIKSFLFAIKRLGRFISKVFQGKGISFCLKV